MENSKAKAELLAKAWSMVLLLTILLVAGWVDIYVRSFW